MLSSLRRSVDEFANPKYEVWAKDIFFVVGSLKYILCKEATELINIVAFTFVYDRL